MSRRWLFWPSSVEAPAPTFNSFSNGVVDNTNVMAHDVTVNLAAGTNRLAVISGLHQSTVAWDGAVFDSGGANETAGVLLATVQRSAGTNLRAATYYIYVPDGPTGNHVFRITKASGVTGLAQVVVWNNVGAGGPYATGVAEDTDANDLTILLTKADADDLLLMFCGVDISDQVRTPRTGSVRAILESGTSASGIGASTADDIAAATGAVDAGWNGSGSGTTLDLVGIAGLFPRL